MKTASCGQIEVGSPDRRRTAFTLAEVSVVVALTSILLASIGSFLIALQRHDTKLRKQSVRSDQQAKLAEKIRTDIRKGDAVSLPTNQTLLITTADDGEIRFELTPEGCRRTAGGTGEATPMTDLYRIGPAEHWTIETGPVGRMPLYIVSLTAGNKAAGEPIVTALLVQAALGADKPVTPRSAEASGQIPRTTSE